MKQKSIKFNAILNVMKTVFSLMFPLITFPYVTRVLQVEAMGKYDFSSSIVSYFALLAALGINTYAVREGARYRNDLEKMSHFASEIFSINIYSTIFAYLLLFISTVGINKLRSYSAVILILSAELILVTISVTWIYTIYEDFGYITLITFCMQFVALALMFLLVHNSGDLNKYAVISVISVNGSGIFMFWHSRKYVKYHFVKKPSLYHLKPILIVFSTALAATIYISSDTTILGWLVDDYHVGIYGTAAKIYKIVKQVLNAIVAVVIPRFAYYIGTGEEDKVVEFGKKLIDYMIVICLPAMVGLFCMSKPIVEAFAGVSYSDSYASLKLLSIALVFAVFANFFANCVLVAYKKEKIVMYATIFSAVINIVLNFILVPFYQEKAAAFTTIVAEICVFVISMHEAKKVIRLSCTGRNLLSTVSGCLGIIICCSVVQKYISNQMVLLITAVLSSGVVYGIILLVLKNSIVLETLERIFKRKTNSI